MKYTHVHLLPWHWFWRTHTNDGTGIVMKWRGPFVFIKLNENIWPETATIKNVAAYRRNQSSGMLRLRFHL